MKHRRRDARELGAPVAHQRAEALRTDLLVASAFGRGARQLGLGPPGDQHARARAAVVGQQVAGAHVVAHHLRRIDAELAQPHPARALRLPHVIGRALAGGRDQRAQHRQHDAVERLRGRVQPVQPRDLRTERIAAVVLAADQPCVLERGQQAQHRALVELRALGELRERQRFVAGAEGTEQAQGAVDRGRASGRGIAVGHRFGLGFAGHGQGGRLDSDAGAGV